MRRGQVEGRENIVPPPPPLLRFGDVRPRPVNATGLRFSARSNPASFVREHAEAGVIGQKKSMDNGASMISAPVLFCT